MIDEKQDKNYYQKKFLSLIEEIDKRVEKPTLFLHACCGPCLTYPLSILIKHFKVTVGFFNPNIYPYEEYLKRLDTLKSFLTRYSQDQGVEIPLVVNEDDFLKYQHDFIKRKDDYEGGKTCLACHAYRMGLAYEYAYQNHFDYFTTVMTVSCKKPSKELNLIAEKLAEKYKGTEYLYSDFKKNDGQLKGIKIAKKYELYRQDYCGCQPSLEERKKIKEQRQSENSLKSLG